MNLRKFLLSLTAFIFLCVPGGFTQTDGCRAVVTNELDKLTEHLQANDYTQLDLSLKKIEQQCGYTEATLRIRLVAMMANRYNTQQTIQLYQDRKFDEVLINRLESAAQPNYRSLYNKKPKAFDFIPLHHSIDSLINLKAAALLHSESYNLNADEERLAYLFSDHINTYLQKKNDRSRQPTGRNKGRTVYSNQRFSDDGGIFLSAGLYTPMNATAPVFGTSPYFGIGATSSLENDFIFDASFKVRLHNNSREFLYFYGQDEWTKSSASYLIGASAGYKIIDLGRTLSFAKVGIASERVNTSIYETVTIDDGWWSNTRTRRHHLRTVNLMAGLAVYQHLFGQRFVGLQAHYHYSPYNRTNRNIITPIDSDYVSVEIIFKF